MISEVPRGQCSLLPLATSAQLVTTLSEMEMCAARAVVCPSMNGDEHSDGSNQPRAWKGQKAHACLCVNALAGWLAAGDLPHAAGRCATTTANVLCMVTTSSE
jgi:hypothetical protein